MHCKIHLNNSVSLLKFPFIEFSKCLQSNDYEKATCDIHFTRQAQEKYKLHIPFTQWGGMWFQTKDTLIVSYL